MAYINKTEKDVFRLITSVGQRKKILSLREEPYLRPLDSALWCTTTEPQRLRWARSTTKFVALFLYRAQNLPYLIFISHIYKHDAIDIADPSSTQDAYHINFVINLAHCSLWLSVRTLERGIRLRRSEVRFLMETQNFFFVPRSWNIFLYLSTELQIVLSLIFYQ